MTPTPDRLHLPAGLVLLLMQCIQCGQPYASTTGDMGQICPACQQQNLQRNDDADYSWRLEHGYKQQFEVNDVVEKTTGDYAFKGVVVAAFQKLNSVWRYVVENDDKLLHIFSGKQLRRVGPSKPLTR